MQGLWHRRARAADQRRSRHSQRQTECGRAVRAIQLQQRYAHERFALRTLQRKSRRRMQLRKLVVGLESFIRFVVPALAGLFERPKMPV